MPLQLFASLDAATALRNEIARHDALYFGAENPEISDREYDVLKERLHELDSSSGGEKMGDDRRAGFRKARHGKPMHSLQKARSYSDVEQFVDRVRDVATRGFPQLVIENKIDGAAISLVYERGSLIRAVSRGNGREGDVLTQQILQIDGCPKHLCSGEGDAVPEWVEIRGEVFVRKSTFDRINAEQTHCGQPEFSTPRNLAAGTLRLQDLQELRSRNLEIAVFDWGIWEPAKDRPASQIEFLDQAKRWGFSTSDGLSVPDMKHLQTAVEESLIRAKASDIPCDGVVIKVNNPELRDKLGVSGPGPNWAIARKFTSPSGTSTVKEIRLQIGRTGTVTPVAIVDPILINGRLISRINLHNPAFLKIMDIRIGDAVVIGLSGDVIPVIREVQTESRAESVTRYIFPNCCPSCGSELINQDSGGPVKCPDYHCPEQTISRLTHFADVLDLPGMGRESIRKLVESGLASSYAGVLRQKPDFLKDAQDAPAWKWIAGLGVPGIGLAAAQRLGKGIHSIDQLLSVTRESLQAQGIPDRIGKALSNYIDNPETRAELRSLIQIMSRPEGIN